MTAAGLVEIIERFAGRRILVLGDLVADRYLRGTATRLAREAPVPVVRVESEELRLGGAANVAHNLAALGAHVRLLGVVGADAIGAEVVALVRAAGIDGDGISVEPHRKTPVRTRVVAGLGPDDVAGQQLLRLDHDPLDPVGQTVVDALLERIDEQFSRAAALAVADYGLGTLVPEIVDRVRGLGGALGAIVTVDSRFDLASYAGVTAVTPSEEEAATLCGLRPPLDGDAVAGATALRVQERLRVRCVLLTRGRRGMSVALPGGVVQHLSPGSSAAPRSEGALAAEGSPPGSAPRAADSTGAGDTVQATFALALAAGAEPLVAAELANEAAALVVRKPGTATVDSAELLRAIRVRFSGGRPAARAARPAAR